SRAKQASCFGEQLQHAYTYLDNQHGSIIKSRGLLIMKQEDQPTNVTKGKITTSSETHTYGTRKALQQCLQYPSQQSAGIPTHR
ncbi:hypothetical protein A2U01_0019765, partial [Trifolium medium]|nr:hypothetical protein [Trifolium medium]